MPCRYSYLQVNFYKRFDGAVSITVVLKESENKVEGSSLSKTFFYFLFFCFRKEAGFFRDLHVCRKTHVLMYYEHVKRLHSVKWRGLYGDTATMQELLLKTCTSSAWTKRNLEWNCHWILYGTGLQHSLALADLPLRKLWKRSRRHMTSSSLGPVVNILAIFSNAIILKNKRTKRCHIKGICCPLVISINIDIFDQETEK